MSVLVSLIITTKNEEAVIAACLRSIENQTYKKIETIVVDNNSSDNTKKIAQSFGAKVLNKGPERSAQRNAGAKHAKGTYLLFLDADMELTPHVVEEAVAMMEDNMLRVTPLRQGYAGQAGDGLEKSTRNASTRNGKTHIVALVIPEKSFGIGFWAACKALERSYYVGVSWIESARFFQKKVFQKIGGYDEELTGPEDFELPQRIKKTYGENSVGRITSFIHHNEGKLSLAKTLRKKYYYGRKMQEYRKRPSSEGYFDKQASVWNRYCLFFTKPVVFFEHPIVFIGMLIMKTLEMGAVALGTVQ